MSEVKHFSITKTVDFYINEASPEIIAGRRIYLETVLIPRLRTGLAVLNKMGLTEREDMELRDVYQRGVENCSMALSRGQIPPPATNPQILSFFYPALTSSPG